MDGQLIFVLLLALWVALKASREQSLPLLLLSVFLIGIGFNIKMIQAFIVVPAVLVIYLLGMRDTSRKKQVLHLGLALLVLAAVSFSWAVAVDQVPASERPYIGGSGDNTVLGLIINYNGLHRLENGQMGAGGPGGFPPGNGIQPGGPQRAASPDEQLNRTADRRMNGDAPGSGMAPPGQGQGQFPGAGSAGTPLGMPMAGAARGGGGMMDNSGTPGFFRLFGEGLGGQISWLLPFACIGLLAWWRRPASLTLKGLEEAGLFSDRGLTLLAMGLWLLPGLAYFSFTTGFWHTYYLATIAPPLAALVGIAAVGMYETYQSGRTRGWVLIAAVAVTGLTGTLFLNYDATWSGLLIPVFLTGVIVSIILLAVLKIRKGTATVNLSKIVACAAIAILFIGPVVWACTPLVYGNGGILPVAGPQLDRGGTGMGGGFNRIGDSVTPLSAYLVSHKTTETWLVGVPSANSEGAGLIISTGEPVMSLGGFSGSDEILTVSSLQGLIDAGRIRYFLGSSTGAGGGMGSGNGGLFTWINESCAAVPAADWGGATVLPDSVPGFGNGTAPASPGYNNLPGRSIAGPGGQDTLYDCAGYRRQTGA